MTKGPVLVIGDTPVAQRVCATLCEGMDDNEVVHLVAPGDEDLLALDLKRFHHAAVLIHDDVATLRYALALAHVAPDLALTVTIFDRTIAERVRDLLPRAVVASSASVAVPSLLGPCLGADIIAVAPTANEGNVEVRRNPDGQTWHERPCLSPGSSKLRRVAQLLRVDHRHQDAGTTMMLVGLLGLAAVLVLDWAWLALLEGHPPITALSEAARVLATVGPGPDHVNGAYGLASAVAMLLTIVLSAMFTAGLVDRFMAPRFVRLRGVGAVPRLNHVIVIGLGQVGLRLCEALRANGRAVVAVERDPDAPCVALARQLRIPVIVGDGTSRRLLEKLNVARCSAVAAVGSNDLDNVAVAVAVSAVSAHTRVVIRAGEQEAVTETRSLLPLGTARDVTAIGAAFIAGRFWRGPDGLPVIAGEDDLHIRTGPGRYIPVSVARRSDCRHVTGVEWPVATHSGRSARSTTSGWSWTS